MAKLINGNGNPAIYAAEDADLIASLAGNVTCIANVGNKYAATEEDATTIRLDDGVIITKEGRRIQLEAGESDTFYIPTGTSGQTNYYIIGYKLVQNADSTQAAEQFVQKMNSSSETITEDTFRGGATEVYVSLYRVTQVDFTITSITGLLSELLDSNSAKDDIAQINSDLDNFASYKYQALETPHSIITGNSMVVSGNMATHDDIILVIGMVGDKASIHYSRFVKNTAIDSEGYQYDNGDSYGVRCGIYYTESGSTGYLNLDGVVYTGWSSGQAKIKGYLYR